MSHFPLTQHGFLTNTDISAAFLRFISLEIEYLLVLGESFLVYDSRLFFLVIPLSVFSFDGHFYTPALSINKTFQSSCNLQEIIVSAF